MAFQPKSNLLALAEHGSLGPVAWRRHSTVDHVLQFIGIRGTRNRHVQRNQFGKIGVRETLVKGLHPGLPGPCLHRGVDLVNLILADQVADGRRRYKNFHDHGAAASIRARQKRLTKNSLEHHGKLGTNLWLLVRRKNVNNTIDCGRRRIGVQGGKSQVAGFGDAQGGFDGLEFAHFADEYNVGVFTKCGAKRICKRMSVRVNFALVHKALLMIVKKLDGILDGNHVLLTLVLTLSSMAARVVDLPEPVGPVTRTSPRGLSHKPFTICGNPSASKPLISQGIVRKTAPTAPR